MNAFEKWYYETEMDGLTIEEIARVAWWAGKKYQEEFDNDLLGLSGILLEKREILDE